MVTHLKQLTLNKRAKTHHNIIAVQVPLGDCTYVTTAPVPIRNLLYFRFSLAPDREKPFPHKLVSVLVSHVGITYPWLGKKPWFFTLKARHSFTYTSLNNIAARMNLWGERSADPFPTTTKLFRFTLCTSNNCKKINTFLLIMHISNSMLVQIVFSSSGFHSNLALFGASARYW